jgi:anti-sigma regulatory factor (Ser/Thr protein kinase)
MRGGRRFLAVVASIVLLGVVVVSLVMVTAVVFPVALAIELAVLALVVGVASRVRHSRGRRLVRGLSSLPRTHRGRPGGPQDTHAPEQAPGPRWVMQWDSRPPVPDVPLTRARLSVVLGEWDLDGETREDILLVVTELLSNAVDHGRGPVRLAVEFRGEAVRVEVHDTGPDPPRPLPPDPQRARGRGLHLIEALSSRWGWADDPAGKTVWAEVPNVRPTGTDAGHPADR